MNKSPKLNLKELERDVGFLVHISMAFPSMKPFLRGFYLTMNSWRKDRSSEGWKMPWRVYKMFVSLGRKAGVDEKDEHYKASREAPDMVKSIPLLKEHVEVLCSMFSSAEPALRLVRGCGMVEVLYVFGDASGEGFGSSWWKSGSVKFRYGVWGVEGKGTSSNYREFRNLVDSLEVMGKCGELKGKEIFLFTDNSTTEHIARKGSSTSPILFDLVVRLYLLEMKFQCSVRCTHVAGTRMIYQGTDGLSRGDLLEGVMKGKSMLDFIPLNESATERSPFLKEWIKSWSEGSFHEETEFLTHQDWVWRGQDISGMRKNIDGIPMPSYSSGTMVWDPPPAAALFAIENLRQSRHKRQKSFHILVVPKLLTGEWRKNVLKSADLILEIPAGHRAWPSEMYESLTLALFFPYLSRKPWELRRTKFMVEMERTVQGVLKESDSAGGSLLSQLCLSTKSLESMPLRDLYRVLSCQRKVYLSN